MEIRLVSMIYKKPVFQELTFEGIRHIAAQDAYTMLIAGAAILVDLREESEYAEGVADVSGLEYFPLSKAKEWHYDTRKTCILMCAHGIRSVRVCDWLKGYGVHNLLNLDGGFEQWKLAGMPVRFTK